MKSSLLTLVAVLSLFSQAQAATIYEIRSGATTFAKTVVGSSGDFYDQSFISFDATSPTNALSAAVTGNDLTTYAWTPNAHMPTVNDAYIDLSFGKNVVNGTGADLVLFFAGTGTNFKDGHSEPYLFSIDVGADGIKEGDVFNVTASTTDDIYGNEFFASYAIIDLDAFGFGDNESLGDIRIHLGDSSMPALAALGAYHVAPVPLPLSSVLFGSGLALLSLFRRKTQA